MPRLDLLKAAEEYEVSESLPPIGGVEPGKHPMKPATLRTVSQGRYLPPIPEAPQEAIHSFSKSVLPPLPTSGKDVPFPGRKVLKTGANIIRENPEGAARAIPAIVGTGMAAATALTGGSLSVPAAAGYQALAGAGGKGLETLAMRALGKPMSAEEAALAMAKEGAVQGGAELVGGGAGVGLAKAGLGLTKAGAKSTIFGGGIPAEAVERGISNPALTTGAKYTAAEKNAITDDFVRGLLKTEEETKLERGLVLKNVDKNGRGKVPADDLLSAFDDHLEQVGLTPVHTKTGKLLFKKTGKIDNASDEVRNTFLDLRKQLAAKAKTKENLTAQELVDFRSQLRKLQSFDKKFDKQMGEHAANDLRNTVNGFRDKYYGSITKQDEKYEKLVDLFENARQSMGLKGEASVDRIDSATRRRMENIMEGIFVKGDVEVEEFRKIAEAIGKPELVGRMKDIATSGSFLHPTQRSLRGSLSRPVAAAMNATAGSRPLYGWLLRKGKLAGEMTRKAARVLSPSIGSYFSQ